MPSATDFLELYRAGDLTDFYALPPGDLEAARAQPRRVDREALAAAMRRYAEARGAPRASLEAIDRLAHPAARAVVTGQQAGLLLGPAYALSKAVTAVALARRLDRSDAPVVPVFWLASQDHDTAEIDHAYLLDLEERLHRVSVALPPEVPAGRIRFEPGLLEPVDRALAAVAAVPAHREEVAALVAAAAARAESYADLFGGLLVRLLGGAGLVLFDPMQADAAALLAPTLARELDDPRPGVEAVREAGRRLERRGLSPQLGRAEGTTNLFLEEVDAGLPRRRLLRHDGRRFHTAARAYDPDELRELLARDPRALTPAAGLRPTVQDAVLPTLASVVGPGELRYLAQLRGVYEHHGVAMPLVWPRVSATVLEPPARRILDRYGLEAEAFARAPDARERDVLLRLHGHAERFEAWLARLGELGEELRGEVAGIDPTLVRSARRGEEHVRRTVELLQGKTARALAERDAVARGQFARLRAHLLPDGLPQERVLSPASFFLKLGVGPVVDAFLALPPEGAHEIRF